MHIFDEQHIREILSRHPPSVATAFGAACAHRLTGAAKRTGGYDKLTELAERALQHVETVLLGGGGLHDDLSECLLAAIPDEDDELDFAAGIVDDALSSTYFTLRSVSCEPVVNACHAATRAYDTAFRAAAHYLNSPILSDATQQRMLESDIVQQELGRQTRDLKDVGGTGPDTDDLIRRLLMRAKHESMWN